MKDRQLIAAGEYRFTYLVKAPLQFRYLLAMLVAHSHLSVRKREDGSDSHNN